ncbi:hypothetical protein LguiB_000368 [Lonicera macranthoides]
MAKISIFAVSLAFLLLGSIVSARQQQQQQGECQIQRISAQEPSDRLQSEAGQTEFWNNNNEQFQCAGVSLIRHNIQPRGLLLPSYTNTPLLVYIEQGRGMQGMMLPGCPETFQSSQQSQQQQEHQGQGQGSRQDRHQRLQQFRKGDILAIPAGAAHWMYNDGENDLVAVVLLDNANNANQLDQNPRRFFLAGNPRKAQQQQQMRGSRHSQSQQQETDNVFSGFDTQTLAEAFGVDEETARKLKGEQDERGPIVRVERGLQTVRPPFSREEERQQQQGEGRGNGLEETVCSARFRENIDDPSRADIYNPRAGRLSTLNSYNLPILRHIQLSAERQNAIMAPHWMTNSHRVLYATGGEARIQIVDHRGQAVFDDQVREGQVVIAPQNFAVVKQASEQGFEWVAFRTNDNAMMSTLSGRTSALRGMPVEVIANAYQISREQAYKLKFNREETILFSGSTRRSGRRAVA